MKNNNTTKWLSTRSLSLLERLSLRRIQAKIRQGHYPSARRCECGENWLIAEKDIGSKSSLDRKNH